MHEWKERTEDSSKAEQYILILSTRDVPGRFLGAGILSWTTTQFFLISTLDFSKKTGDIGRKSKLGYTIVS